MPGWNCSHAKNAWINQLFFHENFTIRSGGPAANPLPIRSENRLPIGG